MADQLGRSVGDMYQAAFIPGLTLTAMYAGYVMLISIPILPLSRSPSGATERADASATNHAKSKLSA